MFFWFQYMSYIFLMIFPLSLVPILVTFQQTDVSSRIACSALPAQARTLQLGLGCICYSILMFLAPSRSPAYAISLISPPPIALPEEK